MSQIELSLSEEFHRSKRNLLLASAITTVLAVSRADPIKVPGLGVDAKLPAITVFSLLLIVLLYLGSTFVVDFLTMRARNSQAVTSDTDSRIDDRIAGLQEQIRQHADQLQSALRNGKVTIDRLSNQFANYSAKEFFDGVTASVDNQVISQIKHHGRLVGDVSQFVGQRIDEVRSLTVQSIEIFSRSADRLDEIEASFEGIEHGIRNFSADLSMVATQFTRLSQSIGGAQRHGFVILQGIAPGGAAIFAAGCCVRYIARL